MDYSDKTAVNIRPNIKNKDTVILFGTTVSAPGLSLHVFPEDHVSKC